MKITLNHLKIGQEGIIDTVDIDKIPLKLLEMGCLPGGDVQLLQIAPLGDPMYFNINGSHLAIRKETARAIEIIIEKNN